MARAKPPRKGPGAAAVSAAQQATSPGFFNTAGGFLIGVLADVLFVQFMRGGWPQVTAWLKAKFLNDATGGAGKIMGGTGLGTVLSGAQGATAGAGAGAAPTTSGSARSGL